MEIHLHGLTKSQRYKAQAGELSYTIRETIPPQLLGCPRRTRAPALWDGNKQLLLVLDVFLVLDSCAVEHRNTVLSVGTGGWPYFVYFY